MRTPVLYGAASSVYVRAARLALAEKGVAYNLVDVDVFAPGGPPVEHMARHPFGKVPAFEHDGFQLYEAGAISRYVDEAFDGPPLQPVDPRDRARMTQIISILDSYAYRTLVWDIFVERVDAPQAGRATKEARIARALPQANVCLTALEESTGTGPWLTGSQLTLADLHAAPMIALFLRTPEGRVMLEHHAALRAWWAAIGARPSIPATSTRGAAER